MLDYLEPIGPVVKPMFGCYAIYSGEKIVLILRQREDHPDINGIWIATSHEAHASLRREFPGMHSIPIFSDGATESAWQMISSASDDFESSAIRLCELVLKNDERIGRIPQRKRPGAKRKRS
ncbi:MAG: hypothetical protein AB1458_05550 [Bacteroidota bacterium]